MATIYERLVQAGAPEITEPHFYRIKEGEGRALIVELRKRNAYGGSGILETRTVYPKSATGAISKVVQALREIVDAHLLQDALNELVGEHAPSPAPPVPTWLEN